MSAWGINAIHSTSRFVNDGSATPLNWHPASASAAPSAAVRTENRIAKCPDPDDATVRVVRRLWLILGYAALGVRRADAVRNPCRHGQGRKARPCCIAVTAGMVRVID